MYSAKTMSTALAQRSLRLKTRTPNQTQKHVKTTPKNGCMVQIVPRLAVARSIERVVNLPGLSVVSANSGPFNEDHAAAAMIASNTRPLLTHAMVRILLPGRRGDRLKGGHVGLWLISAMPSGYRRRPSG